MVRVQRIASPYLDGLAMPKGNVSMASRKRPVPPVYTVAFGVDYPEVFSTAAGAFEYLDQQLSKHGKGCFSVDGPCGTWAGFYAYDLWSAIAEDADKFQMYYRMVASQ
jgi:hypothetical protein